MNKYVFIIIVIVLLVTGFVEVKRFLIDKVGESDVYSPRDIWEQKDALLNSEIVVQGKIYIEWICDAKIACENGKVNCRSCDGEIYLWMTDKEKLLLMSSILDVECEGIQNYWDDRFEKQECALIQPNKKYKLSGMLKLEEGKYYLDIHDVNYD